MAFDQHSNLIKFLITVAPSTPTAGTTLSITNADGASLVSKITVPYNITVCPSTGVIDPTTSEILRVTAVGAADSGGVGNRQLTITRQAETGGINRSILVGDVLYVTPTAKTFTDIENALNNALYTSQVTNEVPTGLVNSSNTTYATAALFNSGSLRVFLNGIRLKGLGVDYTENGGLNGFSLVTAPITGDTLFVDYNTSAGVMGIGTNNWITNEVPTGLINGANTVYTTSQSYIAGTTQVYRDGQLMQGGGNDYTETTPASGTITFIAAPVTGSTILVTYQHAVATGGNANTVNGFSANATPTANQIPVLDASIKLPVSGILQSVQQSIAIVNASTVSTTDVIALSVTFTPTYIANILITFNLNWYGNTTNFSQYASIYLDGVAQSNNPFIGYDIGTINKALTMGGSLWLTGLSVVSHIITIRYHTNNASNTATIGSGILTVEAFNA